MNCYKLDYLGISKFKLKLGEMYVFKRHSTTVILLAYVQKLLKLSHYRPKDYKSDQGVILYRII